MEMSKILAGGDPRSLGRTEEVITAVLGHREALNELFNCLFVPDETVRMRAGDALEKVCRQKPERFEAYKQRLLTEVPKIRQASVQWHLAQMLDEISLSRPEETQAVAIMKENLASIDDWIVTNLTLKSLASFTRRGALDRSDFISILEQHQQSRHKSVVARANKLLKEFSNE